MGCIKFLILCEVRTGDGPESRIFGQMSYGTHWDNKPLNYGLTTADIRKSELSPKFSKVSLDCHGDNSPVVRIDHHFCHNSKDAITEVKFLSDGWLYKTVILGPQVNARNTYVINYTTDLGVIGSALFCTIRGQLSGSLRRSTSPPHGLPL